MKKKEKAFCPPLSRRQFNKLTLATSAGFMFGANFFTGCGSSDSNGNTPKGTESRSLHFDLNHLDDNGEYTLHTDAVRYKLKKHTVETLAKISFGLDGFNRPSHYVENISFTSNKAHAFHVTTHDPERGKGFLMAALHIPQASRDKIRENAIASGLYMDKETRRVSKEAGNVCSMQDQVTDEFLTGYDSAKTIVFHHPEISSLDPDTAAQVELHIDNSSAVTELAQKICELGPAFTHDPKYYDGWCVLVPINDADGNPKLDKNGDQQYDYQFNPDLNDYIRSAVHEVLKAIKNDPDLKGVMYTSHPVGSDENEPVESDDGDSTVAAIGRRVRSGEKLTATFTGYRHNVHYKTPSIKSTSPQTFEVVLANWNFLCYGLYVEYLDASGTPIEIAGPGSFIQKINNLSSTDTTFLESLESPTMKLVDMVLSPPTLFGVPLPSAKMLDIELPDGAVSVRISLCGPGAFGKVDYSPALLPGIALSVLLNLCLPMAFLWSGSGLDETASLWTILKKPGNMFSLVMVGVNAVKEVMDFNKANSLGLLCSLESLLAKVEQNLIQVMFDGTVVGMKDWFEEKEAEEQVEESIPFTGWAVRIMTVVGTIADIHVSLAETLTLPVAIQNTVTFTNTVALTVNCDEDNYQFPEESTYYEVRFNITGSAFPAFAPQGFDLTVEKRGQTSFTVDIGNVPTSGLDTDEVEIWFYDDRNKGFLAAHGKSSFSNKAEESSDNVTAAITIIQNPYPIDATTVYHQHRKLAYSGGEYIWQESSLTDPVPTSSDCVSGLCALGNISIWVPAGMIGYSWTTQEGYHIKNINAIETDPNTGMKTINSTESITLPPVFYDKEAPRDTVDGNHFFLEPKDTSTDNPIYELRKLNLDKTSNTYNASGSWGRFRIELDRIAAHPLGYIVGISKVYSKMAVLELPAEAYDDDNHSNNAIIKFGEGVGDTLIKTPVALTVSHTGAILILQGDTGSMSIRSFDVHGNPWNYFNNGTSSALSLTAIDAGAIWLDISIDDTELIYILSYTGSGANSSDYHLDIYKKDGTHVLRNTGIAVHSMVVDKFRTLYTLNQEMISGSGIIEPSVSVWLPEG